MSLADDVARMEDELDRARYELERLADDKAARDRREAQACRIAYRRGYRAGWAARIRGGAMPTSPERRARGALGALMRS